jgi:hypothetical protein
MTIIHHRLLLHLNISLFSLLHPLQLHLPLINIVHLVNVVLRVIYLEPGPQHFQISSGRNMYLGL